MVCECCAHVVQQHQHLFEHVQHLVNLRPPLIVHRMLHFELHHVNETVLLHNVWVDILHLLH